MRSAEGQPIAGQRRGARSGVLRHRSFRYLFLAQGASTVGDHLVIVALALFITLRTGSAGDLGLVLGARALALVALLLVGGVWADRLPRVPVMMVSDLIRGALHALLAVLVLSDAVRIWEIALIEGAFGGAQAFFQPAYTGLLPQTVTETEIQPARALSELLQSIGYLLGPALATALVLGVGAGEAFAFDAATFVLSAALLTRVRPRRRGSPEPPEDTLSALRSGWREVRSRTWVWVSVTVVGGLVLCLYTLWNVLAPVIARHTYGDTGLFGILEALAGAGAVAGAVAGLRWHPRRPLRAGYGLVLLWPLQNAALALHAPVAPLVALALATGFSFTLLLVWWETALADHIPPGALSRVSAWDWMGSLALMPLVYLLAGPLTHLASARLVLGIGSAVGLGMVLAALASRSVRELRPSAAAG